MPGKNSSQSLNQQMQNLDARHLARQAQAQKPLTTRQAAAKFIASIKQNNKGTEHKPLPPGKVGGGDKRIK